MLRESGQPLGSFPGQHLQGAQGVRLDVEVLRVFMCPQRECNQQFPNGLMVVPLTARGVTVDGRRLSGCSWSCHSRVVPLTLMSALESGLASTVACPLREDMWTFNRGG